MGETIRLDVRDLPPPGPLERVMEALKVLRDDDTLVVAIHREPYILYELLERRGFARQTRAIDDGTYEVYVTRRK